MAATNPITKYRKAAERLRSIARNKGTTLATTYAKDRALAEQDSAVGVLLRNHGDHGYQIVGLLVEESKLADRDWQNRPELKSRLLSIRRTLRIAEDSL
jgi:hypothetical protein